MGGFGNIRILRPENDEEIGKSLEMMIADRVPTYLNLRK
jgi:hypothetical protein